MTLVEITGIKPCECPAHARVVLRDQARPRCLNVRVHAPAGQSIAAELAGVPCTTSGTLDMLRDALAAAGGSIESVTIWHEGGELLARAQVRASDASISEIGVEPCEALVAACRLKLPLFVEEAAPRSDVPDVYREFVETLDLGGLGHTPQTL